MWGENPQLGHFHGWGSSRWRKQGLDDGERLVPHGDTGVFRCDCWSRLLTLRWVSQGLFPAVLMPFVMGITWLRAKLGLLNLQRWGVIPTWVAGALAGSGEKPPGFLIAN